ncbi:DUF4350 domain-containing protein [Chitinimonas sp.]|uniref:DUF4350 domain-containing protein n=1 Tax=Chitinimonas sp. TaxID=1934313 RepID=UPI002F92D2F9
MKHRWLALMSTLLVCLLIAFCAWWWSQNMVRVPKAVPEFSPQVWRHPYNAAAAFLRAQGVKVEQRETLNLAVDGKPSAGLLLLGRYRGMRTRAESEQLMRWVADGGVLVVTAPVRKPDDDKPTPDDEEEEKEASYLDPLFAEFHTAQYFVKRPRGNNEVTPPGSAYPLQLEDEGSDLYTLPGAPTPLWADKQGIAIRAYGYGKGQVVLLGRERFDHFSLPDLDHAELLLRLAKLRAGQTVLIVDRLDMRRWYALLWDHAGYGLAALPLVLLLLLWATLPRFGPRLPDPAPSRRAVLEHIDASARWLWQTPAGRQTLLDALRQDVLATLRRRAPRLWRKPAHERQTLLAQTLGLDADRLAEAIDGPAAGQAAAFTEQIQILQTLRKHHER